MIRNNSAYRICLVFLPTVKISQNLIKNT